MVHYLGPAGNHPCCITIHLQVTAYHKINVRDEALGYSTAVNNSRAVRQRGSSAANGNEDWDKTLLLCFTRHITNTSLPAGGDLRTREQRWCAASSRSSSRVIP